jgi:hypothetical protein
MHIATCMVCDLCTLTSLCLPQGFIEYWSGTDYSAPTPPVVSFTMKLDTDLFDLAKSKTTARSLEVSRRGGGLQWGGEDAR